MVRRGHRGAAGAAALARRDPGPPAVVAGYDVPAVDQRAADVEAVGRVLVR
ncbi:MAG: hypothetical protein U0168_26285 [Nannocystaceae bacterium]